PIDFYVDVYLGVYPPSLNDILEAIKASILGFKPRLPDYLIYIGCKLNENEYLPVRGGTSHGLHRQG
ncbi:MAG: hypothetical protein N3E44_05685, partial [Candidatus Bathyarchaeota archaeon]|nr:hypothetical protein [Candidatus Bathyarchaeota archaeon]